MRIEHIAMYVENLEDAKNFFIKYFNAVPSEKYHNKKTDFRSYFLSFEDDTRLEIMNKPSLNDTTDKLSGTGYVLRDDQRWLYMKIVCLTMPMLWHRQI